MQQQQLPSVRAINAAIRRNEGASGPPVYAVKDGVSFRIYKARKMFGSRKRNLPGVLMVCRSANRQWLEPDRVEL
jgi:hypothetical protein